MRPNIQRLRGGTSAHYRASRLGPDIPTLMAPRSHGRSNAAWRDLICRGGLCSIPLAACRAAPAFNSPCRRSQTLHRDAALVAVLKKSRSGRYRSAERLDLTREPRTGRRCASMTQRRRLTTSAMSTAMSKMLRNNHDLAIRLPPTELTAYSQRRSELAGHRKCSNQAELIALRNSIWNSGGKAKGPVDNT
jgi:hypothetical protein